MPQSPTPPPTSPYRGPLRFLDGAPSLQELAAMGAMLLGAALLLLIAWRLLGSYVRGRWNGIIEPSPWQLVWAAVSGAAGGGLLILLWRNLEHIAARMGVGVAVFGVLLLGEARSGGRGRR